MPATRKTFSRAHHNSSKPSGSLSLSSFTSKSNPTADHLARRRTEKAAGAGKGGKGGMGRKQHAGVKERDREMMESLGARDMGWGTRGLVGGVTAPLPEVSNPSGGEKSSSTATSLVGPGSMNEERRKRLGRDKVGDLVGVLGGLSTK